MNFHRQYYDGIIRIKFNNLAYTKVGSIIIQNYSQEIPPRRSNACKMSDPITTETNVFCSSPSIGTPNLAKCGNPDMPYCANGSCNEHQDNNHSGDYDYDKISQNCKPGKNFNITRPDTMDIDNVSIGLTRKKDSYQICLIPYNPIDIYQNQTFHSY